MGAFASLRAHVKKAFSVLFDYVFSTSCAHVFFGNTKHKFIPQLGHLRPHSLH